MTTTVTRARIENWNPAIIRQKLTRILRDYRPVLAEELRESIKATQFSWPRTTKRKNGQLAGLTRNIVDTGAFLASQRDFQPEPLELVYAWGGAGPVTYAGIILKGKGASYPPLDWITKALQKQPLVPFIQARW
jgi:hypothetical protein